MWWLGGAWRVHAGQRKRFMKMFKMILMVGAAFVLAMAPWSVAAPATALSALETSLAWAQMMAETPGGTVSDEAWRSYWHNETGCFASALILVQEDKQAARPPALAADPNARFRAAATPEENLARVPAPKVTTESDYIAKLRPGESAGVSMDYARIEPLINRHLQDPTSTAAVIPPLAGYGVTAPFVGYGWGGRWGGGWGGWGWRRNYWVAPCALAAPVYYDPYCCGGISGGFFYRGRNFGIGVRF